MRRRFVLFFAITILSARLHAAEPADNPVGQWEATVALNRSIVPFRFEITRQGDRYVAWFFNGAERFSSSEAALVGDELVFAFESYAAQLDVRLKDGTFDGEYRYVGATRRGPASGVAFHATRAVEEPARQQAIPQIAGEWELEVQSYYGETAQRLVIRQNGDRLEAAISRIDGDSGVLEGQYRDGRFVLGHFDGARPQRLEIEAQADSSLQVVQSSSSITHTLVAYRADVARKKGLAAPLDPLSYSQVKQRDEPFHFGFPDLQGRLVTERDLRFQGKVLIVTITGSWCPNCHDEAPFLEALYRKYRQRGLEVVAFNFEEEEQLKNPARLRAFLKQFGIDYTVLLAGQPDQLDEKLPQLTHLDAVPSTIFIDRNGLVQNIHAGFAGKATGKIYDELWADTTQRIERLLAEPVPAASVVDASAK